MEMRAFVLTFPLFSEYDLIPKRKRDREARSKERRREEEPTVTVTVQSVMREGNKICEEVREGRDGRVEKRKSKEFRKGSCCYPDWMM